MEISVKVAVPILALSRIVMVIHTSITLVLVYSNAFYVKLPLPRLFGNINSKMLLKLTGERLLILRYLLDSAKVPS